jgi:hypothetical protein
MEFSRIQIIVVVVMFFVFAYILWSVPKRQVKGLANLLPEERLKLENETRKIMAEIVGGACLLIGLIFTWETVKGTAENLRISQKSLVVAQEGQNIEQFIRAMEQLGKVDEGKESHLAIRLGGIRGLERLADTSSRDYWPIMEILTTYIREQARWQINKMRAGKEQVELKPEIQAILSVLGNRSKSYGEGETRIMDLKGVDLRGANLEMYNFDGADFSLAHLEKTILKGIKLKQASLRGAYLNNAGLEQAQLQGAILSAADLSDANLTGAVFKDAIMDEVDFSRATLDGADFIGVNLKNARNLTREQIKSAKMDQTTRLPDGL